MTLLALPNLTKWNCDKINIFPLHLDQMIHKWTDIFWRFSKEKSMTSLNFSDIKKTFKKWNWRLDFN